MFKLFKILGISTALLMGLFIFLNVFPYCGDLVFGGYESAERGRIMRESFKVCYELESVTTEEEYSKCVDDYRQDPTKYSAK